MNQAPVYNTSTSISENLPIVHINCETKSNGLIGSTSLPVIRVELNDDGSYTAVTNYWPKEIS